MPLFFLMTCLEDVHFVIVVIVCRDVLSALGWRDMELLALAGDFFINAMSGYPGWASLHNIKVEGSLRERNVDTRGSKRK